MTVTSTLQNLKAAGFHAEQSPHPLVKPQNWTKAYPGFHLSYNPIASDYGSDTTALVISGRVHLVLNGNHGQAMLKAAQAGGVHACIDYFIANLAQANERSEHLMATGVRRDPFELIPTTKAFLGVATYVKLSMAVEKHTKQSQATQTESSKPSSPRPSR